MKDNISDIKNINNTNITEANSFIFNQPFFSYEVKNYHERRVSVSESYIFYEFSTPAIIEKKLDDLFMNCIPDGCIDTVFIHHNNGGAVEFIGTPLSHKPLQVYPDSYYFGIRMQPGLFFSKIDLSKKDLVDKETIIDKLPTHTELLMEQIFSAPGFNDKIKVFLENTRSDIRTDSDTDMLIYDILTLISRSRGSMDMKRLSDEVCYSERHMRRLFTDSLGYSPKMFARIVRFQNALQYMLKNPDIQISEYIESLNYTDQSHFQKEFKEFTGLTPGRFSKTVRSLQLPY